MVRHTHEKREPINYIPWRILVLLDGNYYIGEYDGVDYDCGNGVTVGLYDDFFWYDLSELEDT